MFAVSPHSKRWRAAAVAISVSLLSPVALPPPAQAADAELASWTALRPVVTATTLAEELRLGVFKMRRPSLQNA